MQHALSAAIALTDWQFFVTPSYGRIVSPKSGDDGKTPSRRGGKVPPVMVRRRMLFQFLRKVSKGFSCPFERMLWVAREEKGERGGREHWHVLIGGMRNLPSNPQTNCFKIQAFWEQCGTSAGGCDVRVYDSGRDAASYILKGMDDVANELKAFDYGAANEYELSKFDDVLADRKLILAREWIRRFARKGNKRLHRAPVQKIVTGDRSSRGERKGGVPKPTSFAHPYAPEFV